MKIRIGVVLLVAGVLAACAEQDESAEGWARVQPPDADTGVELAAEGRLMVVFAPGDAEMPHRHIGFPPTPDAAPVFGRDIADWSGETPVTLEDDMAGFPHDSVEAVPAGTYRVQAVYKTDFRVHELVGEGSWLSEPVTVNWPEDRGQLDLQLSRQVPDELPRDRPNIRFVRIRSDLLSEFHDRDIYLRAGVILPSDWETSGREYPVRYNIGGYGARYDRALRMMAPGSDFRNEWFDPGNPKFIVVTLDGTAPFGDSYQTNSRNNGPYGDALVEELIPHIEERFPAIGEPEARFLDGGSTGGWASLAVQIFYPAFFNGAWSFCADSPDFHRFQLVNLYEDDNAYTNRFGYPVPSMRTTDGDPMFSIEDEIRMEQVLGRGDSFATSGGQWGGWHAVYGPRGEDGLPEPAWNEETGAIDQAVVEQWGRYDLRRHLEANWDDIGENLKGKLHVWMGDMDNFYLNLGMYRFADALDSLSGPEPEADFHWGRRKGHCWRPVTDAEIMRQMAERLDDGGS